jgi:hypothetical protein
MILGVFLVALGCGGPTPKPAASAVEGKADGPSGEADLLLGSISAGGEVTMKTKVDGVYLQLKADERVLLRVSPTDPADANVDFSIRRSGDLNNGHSNYASQSSALYVENGAAPTQVLITVYPNVAGTLYGDLTVKLTATSTKCGNSCNDRSTPICDESNGTCAVCGANYTSSSASACDEHVPICDSTGTCVSCNGDEGSGSTLSCPASLPHCRKNSFGYAPGCQAFGANDFTPPASLANREVLLPLSCTWAGAPVSNTIAARLVLGPKFLEPSSNANDRRPQAYIRDLMIDSYSARALDNDPQLRQVALPWSTLGFLDFMDIVLTCGPVDSGSFYSPYATTTTSATEVNTGGGYGVTCHYAVVGNTVEVSLENTPADRPSSKIECHGTAS